MIRLISGIHKNKRLFLPSPAYTRPTSDRGREAIFNILTYGFNLNWRNLRVLDAFAGSGALGLEALSRGASHSLFTEINPQVLQTLKKNVQALDLEKMTTILQGDPRRLRQDFLPVSQQGPRDLVFLDPPYEKDLEIPTLENLQEQGFLTPQTVIVLERLGRQKLPPHPALAIHDTRHYGCAAFYFLTWEP